MSNTDSVLVAYRVDYQPTLVYFTTIDNLLSNSLRIHEQIIATCVAKNYQIAIAARKKAAAMLSALCNGSISHTAFVGDLSFPTRDNASYCTILEYKTLESATDALPAWRTRFAANTIPAPAAILRELESVARAEHALTALSSNATRLRLQTARDEVNARLTIELLQRMHDALPAILRSAVCAVDPACIADRKLAHRLRRIGWSRCTSTGRIAQQH